MLILRSVIDSLPKRRLCFVAERLENLALWSGIIENLVIWSLFSYLVTARYGIFWTFRLISLFLVLPPIWLFYGINLMCFSTEFVVVGVTCDLSTFGGDISVLQAWKVPGRYGVNASSCCSYCFKYVGEIRRWFTANISFYNYDVDVGLLSWFNFYD